MQEINWDQIEQALKEHAILICVEDRTIVYQKRRRFIYRMKNGIAV